MRDTGNERTRQNNSEKVMGLLVLQCFKCSEEKKKLASFSFSVTLCSTFSSFYISFFFFNLQEICADVSTFVFQFC